MPTLQCWQYFLPWPEVPPLAPAPLVPPRGLGLPPPWDELGFVLGFWFAACRYAVDRLTFEGHSGLWQYLSLATCTVYFSHRTHW